MQNMPSILIIDDDTALLQALPQAIYLRMKDIQVDTADSAYEALKCIQKHTYDAIISDIKMPGMDGLALLAKIRELRPETPTLLITGHGEHNLALQALRGGAYDFIQKPIDRDYFIAALHRAIQTHQLRCQVRKQQLELQLHAQSLEQLVQERTKELIEANEAKDAFITMASHELKTPLTSLKGMAQLLRRRLERNGSSEVPSVITMERSINRIEILVQDLLSTALIGTRMFTLQRQRCRVAELCQQIVDEYVVGAYPTPIIHMNVMDESLEVDIDKERISQVLLNLLSNARKYSAEDAPITLTLQRIDENCVIAVHDMGVGISANEIPHIFERFYRVPNNQIQTGSSFGLGLGLYISRQIMEQHGGRINVQSDLGHGSTFSIILPLSSTTRSRE